MRSALSGAASGAACTGVARHEPVLTVAPARLHAPTPRPPSPHRVDHPLKGQAIYAFVTLRGHGREDDTMRKALGDHVRK